VLASTPYWQRLLVLAPAFVIGAGAVLAVLILLGRSMKQSIADSNHKGLIYVGLVLMLIFVAIGTILGIKLPRE
jgi:hypothetical protein